MFFIPFGRCIVKKLNFNSSLHLGLLLGSFWIRASMNYLASEGISFGYSILILSTYINTDLHLLFYLERYCAIRPQKEPYQSLIHMLVHQCTKYLLISRSPFFPRSQEAHNLMSHNRFFLTFKLMLTNQNHITWLLFQQIWLCFQALYLYGQWIYHACSKEPQLHPSKIKQFIWHSMHQHHLNDQTKFRHLSIPSPGIEIIHLQKCQKILQYWDDLGMNEAWSI